MLTSHDIPLGAKPIDRAAHHRTDTAWQTSAFEREDALVLLMQNGMPLIEGGDPSRRLMVSSNTESGAQRPLVWMGQEVTRLGAEKMRVFLGLDKAGAPIFAIDLEQGFSLDGSLIEGLGAFEDMRSAVASLPAMQSNLAATARSLFEWHTAHPFCSRCGAKTQIAEAGWKRVCPDCGAEHFPRTDPVAIMLAVKGNQCLLGRQQGWPPGFWSALAGFVEPGETVEQAAARELFEEARIRSDPATAEYLFCQPWPFPSSLMMGVILQAENMDFATEQDELEAARWITREEARDVLAGRHSEIYCPPPFAVAHHILKTWALRDA